MKKTRFNSDPTSEPLKKKRRSVPNVKIDEALFKEPLLSSVEESIRNRTVFNSSRARVYSTPFACCSLSDFLGDDNAYIDGLRNEVEKLPFVAKINDLYSFQQTDDIRKCSGQYLQAFRDLLSTKVLSFLRQVTGIELSARVDATCSKYEDGDTLLCHDDELEGRRIAFIYYLMPEWSADDGGCLDLFSVDGHGQPDQVVESIVPQPNMFNFFPVTLDSFHQVAEVRSSSRTRLSISGWFYGESFHRPAPYMEPELPLSAPKPDISVEDWVNNVYFKPAVQRKIRKRFEKNSEAQLHAFLKQDKYDEVQRALEAADTYWAWQGPANKRRFEALNSSASGVLKQCTDVLASHDMLALLAKLTGMNLSEDRSIAEVATPSTLPTAGNGTNTKESAAEEKGDEEDDDMIMCGGDDEGAEDDGDDSDDGDSDGDDDDDDDAKAESDEEDMPLGSPTCQSSVRHWSPGCYTLMHDLESQPAAMALDAQLFFKADDWEPHCGGFTCYVAKGEDDELLSVQPATNSFALVCRDSETMCFIKYMNHLPLEEQQSATAADDSAENGAGSSDKRSSFYDIAMTYVE